MPNMDSVVIRRWSSRAVIGAFALGTVLGGGMLWILAYRPAVTPAAAHPLPDAPLATERVLPPPRNTRNSPEALSTAWHRLISRPATPDRDRALVDLLRRLSAENPIRTLALAEQVGNLRLRSALVDAALQGWGRKDPEGAVDWIVAHADELPDVDHAAASVLKGAADDPPEAIRAMLRLSESAPERTRDYGDALIYALGQAGHFTVAAQFAANAPAGLADEWLAAAYGSWTNYQPDAAAVSALALSDLAARGPALDAVIAAWGGADPAGLADFAIAELPAGERKNRALANALVQWSVTDPLAAAQWINRFGPTPEFDQGEAAIATQPAVMQHPDTALRWAQAVTDPNLRSRTVVAILQTWALSDAPAALQYLRASRDILPDDRDEVVRSLAPTQ